MRYQFKLTPCPATSKSSWGKVLRSANTVLELDTLISYEGLFHDQTYVVVDSKTGKEMSENEFRDMIMKIVKARHERFMS